MLRSSPTPASGPQLSRRTFLTLGSTLAAVAAIGGQTKAAAGRALKPIILVWEDGGASSIETFDAKPDSPAEVRGTWGAIPAKTGAMFCDHFPLTASHADELSVIRAIQSKESSHGGGIREYMGDPTLALQYKRGGVKYTTIHVPGGFGFIDSAHQANKADFKIEWSSERNAYVPPSLEPVVGRERLQQRRELLRSFSDEPLSRDQELGLDLLLGGGQLREAFALPDEDREAYGKSPTGDAMLLAERLADAGASFVTVNVGNFDVHDRMYDRLNAIVPSLDRALATLLLRNHDKVIAVCGEFNRTPVINNSGGRDHWTDANTALLNGKPGVYGSTDRFGRARDGVVTTKQYRNTILALAGVEGLPGNEMITQVL